MNGNIKGGQSKNRVTIPLEFLIKTPEGVAITEYQLIRLHQNKDEREFRTVTGGVLHASGGTTRDVVEFEGKRIANRTFSVVLPDEIGAGEYGFLPPGAFGSANSASIGTSLGKKTESILDSRPRLFIPTSVRGSPPMIEYVSVISVSVLLEFFLNPTGLALSATLGVILAACALIGCLRVGRLFNLGYRARFGTVVLALVAAFCAFGGVLSYGAATYVGSLLHDVSQTGQYQLSNIEWSGSKACQTMDSVLLYVNREFGTNVIFMCDSATPFEQLRADFGPKLQEIQVGLENRLYRIQIGTVTASLLMVGICLSIPGWHASRGMSGHLPRVLDRETR